MTKATRKSDGRLPSALRRLLSTRVVLALGAPGRPRAQGRPGRRPVMLLKDRVQAFEEQTARIEAQLAVLEKDTEASAKEASTSGLRLRVRNLEFTRLLLAAHLNTARKLCRRTPTLARFQDYLDALAVPSLGKGSEREELPTLRVDKGDVAGTPVNLERVADLLFLFGEVHGRLRGSSPPAREGDDQEEGVA